jgi:hypothetical protein
LLVALLVACRRDAPPVEPIAPPSNVEQPTRAIACGRLTERGGDGGIVIVDDQIVFGDSHTGEIATLPLAGGPTRTISSWRHDDMVRIVVAGGHVYWERLYEDPMGTLWTVPLRGGVPRPVGIDEVEDIASTANGVIVARLGGLYLVKPDAEPIVLARHKYYETVAVDRDVVYFAEGARIQQTSIGGGPITEVFEDDDDLSEVMAAGDGIVAWMAAGNQLHIRYPGSERAVVVDVPPGSWHLAIGDGVVYFADSGSVYRVDHDRVEKIIDEARVKHGSLIDALVVHDSMIYVSDGSGIVRFCLVAEAPTIA